MKKFFAILLILILFSINTISVKASSTAVIPFDNAIALYDFSNGLQNGLTYDMSKYSNYSTWQEAEEAFYRDILNYLAQVNWGGEYSADQLYNSYYTLDYGMTNSIANDFTKRYNDYVLDPTNGFAIPLGKDVTASWNRFNDYYVKKYLDAVNSDLDSHPVNPDINYQSYLDNINGRGINSIDSFFFSNYPATTDYGGGYIANALHFPFSSYSYFDCSGEGITTYDGTSPCYISDIINLYIYSVDDIYTFTYTPTKFNYACELNGTYWNAIRFRYPANGSFDWETAGSNYAISTYSRTGTLAQVLSYVSNHFRNINIYVDNVLWSYVGVIDNPFISAPDVIFGDNDEMLDNDIPIPNTDGYFDYIALQNLIHEAIENADIIGWDTLIENGIVIDGEGEALQEGDFTKDSIKDIDDDETDDFPLENIIPPPPPPPPLFQDWKFKEINPEEDPRPRAISVLARIVNVTNKSLPSDVMAMFWGICITLLILGLIKIMHK